ncbi:GMC oxidoreductase [Alcanivorax jadensis]|uniref:GMC oxidoreductase n=1 Tax=Alcanivorax jadensis TaxID=64988 RepID=UPI002409269B|nr:GMC family oxidoreductase [Alcanivorax jadensis]MDF1637850.1 GMC family oxidoreductase [Alcanivorax jadensis]
MFFDALKGELPESLSVDVCIIGAGVAGITIAKQLKNEGLRIALVESGGLQLNPDVQDLYNGENIGLPYDPLDACRLRFFGGTSNHWGGWTRPMDRVDFEKREWIPWSGWPITLDDVAPYYEQAQNLVEVDGTPYDAEFFSPESSTNYLVDRANIETKIFKLSPPTRFLKSYKVDFNDAHSVVVLLNSNVVDFVLSESGKTVQAAQIKTLAGKNTAVTATHFVLACGGIENARILLNCRKANKSGLGNDDDLVGRFFSDHDGILSGNAVLGQRLLKSTFYQLHVPEIVRKAGLNTRIVPAFTLAEKILREKSLPNFNTYVLPVPDNAKAKGSLSIYPDIEGLVNFVEGTPLHPAGSRRFFQLVTAFENTPNPNSRVMLGDKRDALGLLRCKLNWQRSDNDEILARRLTMEFSRQFALAGLGRVNIDKDNIWPQKSLEIGRHHMGTTRMSSSPKHGVVDKNCRVHTTNNLFVAGSSVFASYGFAQPTLTIIALALRLSSHIKQQVSRA